MNKVIGLSVVFFAVTIMGGFAIAQQDANAITDERWEATSVLEAFLDAQRGGRTDIVKECLGGDLLKKRSRLFENPEYAEFLRNAYKDTDYEISNSESITKDRVQIDVKFDSYDGESKQMRYLLIKKSPSPNAAPRFLIYSQAEITK